jgi:hypothetical protein
MQVPLVVFFGWLVGLAAAAATPVLSRCTYLPGVEVTGGATQLQPSLGQSMMSHDTLGCESLCAQDVRVTYSMVVQWQTSNSPHLFSPTNVRFPQTHHE